jgi:uncharacterized protein (DUF2252 family)
MTLADILRCIRACRAAFLAPSLEIPIELVMPKKRTSSVPRDRARVLEESRQAKMAESAHRYVRGNTRQLYEWLESKSGKSLPQGPAVWICGDCHVGNIGPLADLKGRVEIQIRDLDQTVIGNPAHDLVRPALSLATAARGSDLPGITLEQMVEGYERGLATPRQAQQVNRNDELAPIRSVLDQAKRRRWHHLATERIKDVRPHIPLGERFWALTAIERKEIATLFANDAVVAKVREAKGRDDKTKVTVVDAAYWMKGCSSLGRLRYAVLLELRKKRDRDYCLIDLKEAAAQLRPMPAVVAK